MVGPPSLGNMPRETHMLPHDPIAPASSREPMTTEAPDEGMGALVRLGWMMGGTLTMLIAGFTIASSPAWTFGLRDVVFWFGALLALALRYLDVARFAGQTSSGEPATMKDFWRYSAALSVVALGGWAAAQSVHL